MTTTLIITIAPSFIILAYFFLNDRFKEPKSTVALVFFLGILICLPAGMLNSFIYDNFNNDPDLKKKYRITVEVLHDTGLINKQKLISIIFQELKLMKIILIKKKQLLKIL